MRFPASIDKVSTGWFFQKLTAYCAANDCDINTQETGKSLLEKYYIITIEGPAPKLLAIKAWLEHVET
jgi:hypothetical protein